MFKFLPKIIPLLSGPAPKAVRTVTEADYQRGMREATAQPWYYVSDIIVPYGPARRQPLGTYRRESRVHFN